MAKRLIICCDGTWNLPENRDRDLRKPTNVMKMVRAIKPQTHDGYVQVCYYDVGVGTHWGLDKMMGGLTGMGLSKNVIEAYRFLVYNYSPGDDIFLFGFSRGAFTVRSLAGLLQHVGLLLKKYDFYMQEAYELYRKRPPIGALNSSLDNWVMELNTFCKEHETTQIPIHFIGVWDTVGALGIPLNLFKNFNRRHFQFHDSSLAPCVRHAYQALAIDEQRKPFKPVLWEKVQEEQVLEQRWFAGVHTNIGGGYQRDGLSNVALHWLKQQAISHGLDVDEDFLRPYRPWYGDELRDSMTWYYRLLGLNQRPVCSVVEGYEIIDDSVFKRMLREWGVYSPTNVLQTLRGIFSADDGEQRALTLEDVRTAESATRCRLPASLVVLLMIRNGGRLRRPFKPVFTQLETAPLLELRGIGTEQGLGDMDWEGKIHQLLGLNGSSLVLANTESTALLLDYSRGQRHEPQVVWWSRKGMQEGSSIILAPDFTTLLATLIAAMVARQE